GRLVPRPTPSQPRARQIHRCDRQRLTPSCRPCPCRQPRLPIISPRPPSATISPVGITRFCSGTVLSSPTPTTPWLASFPTLATPGPLRCDREACHGARPGGGLDPRPAALRPGRRAGVRDGVPG